MSCAHVCRLLDLMEEEEKAEEIKRRHELWIAFATAFYAGRGEAEPPLTKEDHDRQKAKKPKEPTPEEWRRQEEAKRQDERLKGTYWLAAQSPYHFEEAMLFPNHVFDKPKEPERRASTSEERRAQEEAAQNNFIEGLRGQIARQTERAHRASSEN